MVRREAQQIIALHHEGITSRLVQVEAAAIEARDGVSDSYGLACAISELRARLLSSGAVEKLLLDPDHVASSRAARHRAYRARLVDELSGQRGRLERVALAERALEVARSVRASLDAEHAQFDHGRGPLRCREGGLPASRPPDPVQRVPLR